MHAPLKEPFDKFAVLFAKALAAQPKDHNACVLATCDARGRPSARVVLLKEIDARGFVVYTNQQSRKAQDLAAQPYASLCFYWSTLDSQVRVEGPVEVVSAAEADAYFATRPRVSQLGAWASLQSQPLDSRATLLRRLGEAEDRYANQPVPRPPHWGGYRLVPDEVELWQAGDNRLHHRERYTRRGDGWEMTLLFP